MSENPGKAVFLSYASQDAEAARRIADALRVEGIEVWFDESALAGGEAWDASIRRQIRDCALFVAIVSANTQARKEGYFRLEWRLADERSQLIAEGSPFVLPVIVDATKERDALVPKSFLGVQWTWLPHGEVPPAFVTRVQRLLNPAAPGSTTTKSVFTAESSDLAYPTTTPPPAQKELDEPTAVAAWRTPRTDSVFAASSSSAPVTRERRWKLLAGVAALAAVLAVTAAIALWQRAASPGTESGGPLRFSFQLGPAQQIAIDMDQLLFDISRDGEAIAWIGPGGPKDRDVFYRSVRDLTVRVVPGTKGVQNDWLQFSPDGRQVAFQRDNKLWRVPLDGAKAPELIHEGRLWSWAWAVDGSFVLAEPYGGLLRLGAPGQKPETITVVNTEATDEVTHQFPQVLPGGKGILVSVGVKYFHSARIDVVWNEGGTWRRKTVLQDAYSARYVDSGHLVFGRGQRIYSVPFDLATRTVGPETAIVSDGVQTDFAGPVTEFVVSSTGTLVYLPDQGLLQSGLAWVDRKTGLKWLNVAGGAGAALGDPAISSDGSTLFITARFGDRFRQIYRIDLARGIPQRLTTEGMNDGPVLSPDGREVLFGSTSGGYKNLVRRSVSGDNGDMPVTTAKRDHFACGWSRIGRIAYGERLPYDKTRIFTLDVATPNATPQLVTPEGASERAAWLSPDGSRLAYVVKENGTPQVYVRVLSPDGRRAGREERVSAVGGTSPRWRPDGSELVYLSPDERRFLAIPIGAGHTLQVESESILYELPAEIQLTGTFDVAADGRLLFVAREKRTTPMDVMVWIGGVRRQ